MLTNHRLSCLVAFIAWTATAPSATCAIPITVTDTKGRAIEIELVSVIGESVTFKRKGQLKVFTLEISNFSKPSQTLIQKQAALLPAVLPRATPEVSIVKRRVKDGWYMVKQRISGVVKITNPDPKVAFPHFTGKIILLGQNRRTPDALSILSTQPLEGSIEPGKSFAAEITEIVTSYDSDNKGDGNVGGYEYFGYLLVLADDEGKIILDDASTGSVQLAVKNNRAALDEMIDYPAGTVITTKLEPVKATTTLRVPR
jgi:hypothetical protein